MSLAQFAKRAAKMAKENKGGAMELKQDKEVLGILIRIETPANANNRVLVLKTETDETVKYWSFSLLEKLLEQNEIKAGDILYICKRAKKLISKGKWKGKKAWQCDFSFEKAGGKD